MTDSPTVTETEDTGAKGYISAQLRQIREELEALDARADALRARRATLWVDARRAGVSFGKIASVSGVDRTTVFYMVNRMEERDDG